MRGVKWHREPLRILIVSATVGAGDVGNARELARRLTAGGHHVEVRDFLNAPALHLGQGFSKGYEAELRHAPWAYEAAFKMWFWLPFLLRPASRVLSFVSRKRVSAWAREVEADVVVSTYPVATQVLGDMRRRAQKRWRRRHSLEVPAVNVVTDFGYHPFWAHPGIDLNLAVHPGTVEAVARRTGKPSVACEPLVRPAFAGARDRRERKRGALGLARDDVAVLISSGSWGVGDVAETFELVARRPGLVPVVACGHNDKLRQDLQALATRHGHPGIALGWTEDMAGVMAACDVLVENAGGLTCLEAMAANLPVVSFRPIPGHGRNSARVMEAAGVSQWSKDDVEFVDQLELLGRPGPARAAQLAAAQDSFSQDAAQVVALAALTGLAPRPSLRPLARVVRAASAATMLSTLSWFGLTAGVGVAAAAGLGVAHPPPGLTNTAFVGVRLDPQELASPAVQAAVARLDASAVVSAGTAEADPGALRGLVEEGTDVESGGSGLAPGGPAASATPWDEALDDTRSVQVISVLAGRLVTALVPDRSVSAFDLMDAKSAHLTMVVPNVVLPVAPSGPYPRPALALPVMQSGRIYLVDGARSTPMELDTLLADTGVELSQQHLASAPLSALQ